MYHMSRPKVYVTRRIIQPALDKLAERCDITMNPEDRGLTHEELLTNVAGGYDAVLCLLSDPIDDAVLAAAGPTCKIFANYAVGYNNIDVAAATKRGILVCNTPGVLTDATADLAWALLFSVARRVVDSQRFMEAGKFGGWDPLLMMGQDITGATLGVIGTGRIGAAFARRAAGFGMKVIYWSRRRNEELEREIGAVYADKETLLRQADYVSLHVALTPETTHLIGEAEFKLMKKTAILINTARGPVVDEKALVRALKAGEIFGAGLDVYEQEPKVEPDLIGMENVVLLPHIASATIPTRTRMGYMNVADIFAALDGQMPTNCLNPEALENR